MTAPITEKQTARSAHRLALALLGGASLVAIAAPAKARDVVFTTNRQLVEDAIGGKRVAQQQGVTQLRLDSGAVLSFVDGADFRLREGGSVDLYAGSVTVAGGDKGEAVIHVAGDGEGHVSGIGSAASFTVEAGEDGQPKARGHVLGGTATIGTPGNLRRFSAGQMWTLSGEHAHLAVTIGAQAVPPRDGEDSPRVLHVREGGPVAAALNGTPVVLGDALAATGASGDLVAAARRVEGAAANPSIATFPTGDLKLLVGYAARLEGAYGGKPFNGAAADVIRAYLGWLANGGSGAQFLTAYAGFLTQYLDLVRSGAAPSSFTGTSLADINAFIAYRGRTTGFGDLSAQNQALVDAYLAFIRDGGNADLFAKRYTDLTAAYFAFLRGGGLPADFTGASQATIGAYLAFLRDSGLSGALTVQDQALLAAYLNGNGFAFAAQYRSALDAYFAYLAQGKLPSGYTAIDPATLRQYLETLQASGLFDTVLSGNASFYRGYLAYLQGGGSVDGYAQLPANLFTGYANALSAYYDFLAKGGVPSAYSGLTQEQIRAYLAALTSAGASGAFLGDRDAFWSAYFAYLQTGANPDLYAQLPIPPDYPAFADALNAYAAYLRGGGLPSGYSAVDLQRLAAYIQALVAAGKTGLLGQNASLIDAYFTYLAGGGSSDGYSGLPLYTSYAGALQDYYKFLAAGGIPSKYSGLTQAQITAYLKALSDAGVFAQLFSGASGSFLQAYYAYLRNGGSADGYSGIPAYATYSNAISAYYAYLAGGGLPSQYTALTQAQIAAYLKALSDAGLFSQFFSGDSLAFLQAYYTYLKNGGAADGYTGIPVYASYVDALNAYYAFLAGGGLPSHYTALTQAQIAAYLKALSDAGVFNKLLSGQVLAFLDAYYAYILGGGTPDQYAALPANTGGGGGGGGTGSSGGLSGALTSYAGGFTATTGTQLYTILPSRGGGWSSNDGAGVDANGVITGSAQLAIGTASATEVAGDASGVIGRLVNGTASYYSNTETIGANNGLYYALMAPITGSLPTTGTIDYKVLSATSVAYGDGHTATGTFDANLTIGFGSGIRFRMDGTITMPDATYTLSTAGRSSGQLVTAQVGNNPSFVVLRPNISQTGPACGTSTCFLNLYGGFGGSTPQNRLGFAYHSFDPADSGNKSFLEGAVLFGAVGTLPTGGSGGGSGSGTNTPSGLSGTQTGQFLAYANKVIGTDSYANVSVTYGDTLGVPTGWMVNSNEQFAQGSTTVANAGQADGVLTWSRWVSGTPSGNYYSGGAIPVGANGGYHQITGTALTNMPASGTVNYALVGGTPPTFQDERSAPGTLSGSAAVAFGSTPRVGLDLTASIGGGSYQMVTAGGVADPTQSAITVASDGTFDSPLGALTVNSPSAFCSNGCSAFVDGFLAGNGASHMGLSWAIRNESTPQTFIEGTAAFRAGP